jgi:MYXO-CTERM domain-containing protein
MKRVLFPIGILLLTAVGFAQQPDTSRNPTSDTYTRDNYNRPVESRSSYGNWGLLGLIGLTGLLGGRRRETTVHTRDEFSTEQRRRAS